MFRLQHVDNKCKRLDVDDVIEISSQSSTEEAEQLRDGDGDGVDEVFQDLFSQVTSAFTTFVGRQNMFW